MAVFAENGSFRPKNCYGLNFGYGRILAFLKLSLTVSVFRKKFPFGHTLIQRDSKLPELIGSLKFGGFWGFVQLISRPTTAQQKKPIQNLRHSISSENFPLVGKFRISLIASSISLSSDLLSSRVPTYM